MSGSIARTGHSASVKFQDVAIVASGPFFETFQVGEVDLASFNISLEEAMERFIHFTPPESLSVTPEWKREVEQLQGEFQAGIDCTKQWRAASPDTIPEAEGVSGEENWTHDYKVVQDFFKEKNKLWIPMGNARDNGALILCINKEDNSLTLFHSGTGFSSLFPLPIQTETKDMMKGEPIVEPRAQQYVKYYLKPDTIQNPIFWAALKRAEDQKNIRGVIDLFQERQEPFLQPDLHPEEWVFFKKKLNTRNNFKEVSTVVYYELLFRSRQQEGGLKIGLQVYHIWHFLWSKNLLQQWVNEASPEAVSYRQLDHAAEMQENLFRAIHKLKEKEEISKDEFSTWVGELQACSLQIQGLKNAHHRALPSSPPTRRLTAPQFFGKAVSHRFSASEKSAEDSTSAEVGGLSSLTKFLVSHDWERRTGLPVKPFDRLHLPDQLSRFNDKLDEQNWSGGFLGAVEAILADDRPVAAAPAAPATVELDSPESFSAFLRRFPLPNELPDGFSLGDISKIPLLCESLNRLRERLGHGMYSDMHHETASLYFLLQYYLFAVVEAGIREEQKTAPVELNIPRLEVKDFIKGLRTPQIYFLDPEIQDRCQKLVRYFYENERLGSSLSLLPTSQVTLDKRLFVTQPLSDKDQQILRMGLKQSQDEIDRLEEVKIDLLVDLLRQRDQQKAANEGELFTVVLSDVVELKVPEPIMLLRRTAIRTEAEEAELTRWAEHEKDHVKRLEKRSENKEEQYWALAHALFRFFLTSKAPSTRGASIEVTVGNFGTLTFTLNDDPLWQPLSHQMRLFCSLLLDGAEPSRTPYRDEVLYAPSSSELYGIYHVFVQKGRTLIPAVLREGEYRETPNVVMKRDRDQLMAVLQPVKAKAAADAAVGITRVVRDTVPVDEGVLVGGAAPSEQKARRIQMMGSEDTQQAWRVIELLSRSAEEFPLIEKQLLVHLFGPGRLAWLEQSMPRAEVVKKIREALDKAIKVLSYERDSPSMPKQLKTIFTLGFYLNRFFPELEFNIYSEGHKLLANGQHWKPIVYLYVATALLGCYQHALEREGAKEIPVSMIEDMMLWEVLYRRCKSKKKRKTLCTTGEIEAYLERNPNYLRDLLQSSGELSASDRRAAREWRGEYLHGQWRVVDKRGESRWVFISWQRQFIPQEHAQGTEKLPFWLQGAPVIHRLMRDNQVTEIRWVADPRYDGSFGQLEIGEKRLEARLTESETFFLKDLTDQALYIELSQEVRARYPLLFPQGEAVGHGWSRGEGVFSVNSTHGEISVRQRGRQLELTSEQGERIDGCAFATQFGLSSLFNETQANALIAFYPEHTKTPNRVLFGVNFSITGREDRYLFDQHPGFFWRHERGVVQLESGIRGLLFEEARGGKKMLLLPVKEARLVSEEGTLDFPGREIPWLTAEEGRPDHLNFRWVGFTIVEGRKEDEITLDSLRGVDLEAQLYLYYLLLKLGAFREAKRVEESLLMLHAVQPQHERVMQEILDYFNAIPLTDPSCLVLALGFSDWVQKKAAQLPHQVELVETAVAVYQKVVRPYAATVSNARERVAQRVEREAFFALEVQRCLGGTDVNSLMERLKGFVESKELTSAELIKIIEEKGPVKAREFLESVGHPMAGLVLERLCLIIKKPLLMLLKRALGEMSGAIDPDSLKDWVKENIAKALVGNYSSVIERKRGEGVGFSPSDEQYAHFQDVRQEVVAAWRGNNLGAANELLDQEHLFLEDGSKYCIPAYLLGLLPTTEEISSELLLTRVREIAVLNRPKQNNNPWFAFLVTLGFDRPRLQAAQLDPEGVLQYLEKSERKYEAEMAQLQQRQEKLEAAKGPQEAQVVELQVSLEDAQAKAAAAKTAFNEAEQAVARVKKEISQVKQVKGKTPLISLLREQKLEAERPNLKDLEEKLQVAAKGHREAEKAKQTAEKALEQAKQRLAETNAAIKALDDRRKAAKESKEKAAETLVDRFADFAKETLSRHAEFWAEEVRPEVAKRLVGPVMMRENPVVPLLSTYSVTTTKSTIDLVPVETAINEWQQRLQEWKEAWVEVQPGDGEVAAAHHLPPARPNAPEYERKGIQEAQEELTFYQQGVQLDDSASVRRMQPKQEAVWRESADVKRALADVEGSLETKARDLKISKERVLQLAHGPQHRALEGKSAEEVVAIGARQRRLLSLDEIVQLYGGEESAEEKLGKIQVALGVSAEEAEQLLQEIGGYLLNQFAFKQLFLIGDALSQIDRLLEMEQRDPARFTKTQTALVERLIECLDMKPLYQFKEKGSASYQLFEAIRGYRIRANQLDLIEQALTGLQGEVNRILSEQMTGGGKTTTVLPLTIARYIGEELSKNKIDPAHPKPHVMVLWPNTLVGVNTKECAKTLWESFALPTEVWEFDRDTNLSSQSLKKLLSALQEQRETGGVLMLSADSLRSFELHTRLLLSELREDPVPSLFPPGISKEEASEHYTKTLPARQERSLKAFYAVSILRFLKTYTTLAIDETHLYDSLDLLIYANGKAEPPEKSRVDGVEAAVKKMLELGSWELIFPSSLQKGRDSVDEIARQIDDRLIGLERGEEDGLSPEQEERRQLVESLRAKEREANQQLDDSLQVSWRDIHTQAALNPTIEGKEQIFDVMAKILAAKPRSEKELRSLGLQLLGQVQHPLFNEATYQYVLDSLQNERFHHWKMGRRLKTLPPDQQPFAKWLAHLVGQVDQLGEQSAKERVAIKKEWAKHLLGQFNFHPRYLSYVLGMDNHFDDRVNKDRLDYLRRLIASVGYAPTFLEQVRVRDAKYEAVEQLLKEQKIQDPQLYIDFILDKSVDGVIAPYPRALLRCTEEQKNFIALLRGVFSIVQEGLAYQDPNVHFGLSHSFLQNPYSQEHDWLCEYAIPYAASETPEEPSREEVARAVGANKKQGPLPSMFANIERTLLATLLTYLRIGLKEEQGKRLLSVSYEELVTQRAKHPHHQLHQLAAYKTLVELIGEDHAPQDLEMSAAVFAEQNFRSILKHQGVIFRYFRRFIVPEIKIYPTTLESTGATLHSLGAQTLDTSATIPSKESIGPNVALIRAQGTTGQAIYVLLEKGTEDHIHLLRGTTAEELIEELEEVRRRTPSLRAYIDVAALFKGVTNEQWVNQLCEKMGMAEGSQAAICYLSTESKELLVKHGDQQVSLTALPPGTEYLTYFSQRETVGVDVPNPPDAAFGVILSRVLTLSEVAQAMGRARRGHLGQTFEIFLPTTEDETVPDIRALAALFATNEAEYQARNNAGTQPQLLTAKIEDAVWHEMFSLLQSEEGLIQQENTAIAVTQRMAKIYDRAVKVGCFERAANLPPFALYGQAEQGPAREVLEEKYQGARRTLGKLSLSKKTARACEEGLEEIRELWPEMTLPETLPRGGGNIQGSVSAQAESQQEQEQEVEQQAKHQIKIEGRGDEKPRIERLPDSFKEGVDLFKDRWLSPHSVLLSGCITRVIRVANTAFTLLSTLGVGYPLWKAHYQNLARVVTVLTVITAASIVFGLCPPLIGVVVLSALVGTVALGMMGQKAMDKLRLSLWSRTPPLFRFKDYVPDATIFDRRILFSNNFMAAFPRGERLTPEASFSDFVFFRRPKDIHEPVYRQKGFGREQKPLQEVVVIKETKKNGKEDYLCICIDHEDLKKIQAQLHKEAPEGATRKIAIYSPLTGQFSHNGNFTEEELQAVRRRDQAGDLLAQIRLMAGVVEEFSETEFSALKELQEKDRNRFARFIARMFNGYPDSWQAYQNIDEEVTVLTDHRHLKELVAFEQAT